ncbi:MAG: glycosyltransferase [Acidobacteria bacterium]|nr:glycosyltransferase [Acidobacteriota bacterium]
MRILIEPSGYKLGNLGDAAMLVASVERLRALWPGAELGVVTRAPDALVRLCPGVRPLDAGARSQFIRSAQMLPLPLLARNLAEAGEAEQAVRLREFLQFFRESDLLFVSGAGGFTDPFRDHALTTLLFLETAQRVGKPTVLVGQGLGPWDDPGLRAMAEVALPRARALFLRERKLSEPLARALPANWGERLRVTGDDALEMASSRRPATLGAALGVNLRQADYSAVPPEAVERLRTLLAGLGDRFGADLLPVPISHPPNSSDPAAIAGLLGGDGGANLSSPQAVIDQVGCCRLVVTGSYHAAVFALAQGIPAIGLIGSPYYAGKFEGLADLFGPACAPLPFAELERLPALADDLWSRADALRPALLDETSRQIEAGRAAYQALPELITPPPRPRSSAGALGVSGRPAVSVVIPAYNQTELLADALASVRAQTLEDWEAIVVDDCSTEGDVAAAAAAFGDQRIRVGRHDRNRGLAAARNSGFREARADWVLPLDADDLLDPIFLETLLERADENPSADALFARLRYFGAKSGVWRTEAQDAAAFLRRKRMPGAGTLLRKSLWEASGGYCEDPILRGGQEDTDFWLSAFAAGARTAREPLALYWYRRHEQSMTGAIPESYHRIREFLYERHQALIDAHNAGGQFLADGYWRAALGRLRAGRKAAAMVFVSRAKWAARDAEVRKLTGAELWRELESGAWYYPPCQPKAQVTSPGASPPL